MPLLRASLFYVGSCPVRNSATVMHGSDLALSSNAQALPGLFGCLAA